MPTAGKYKWPASSRERFANTNKIIKQLLNSVLVGYEELLRPWFVLSSNYSSYPTNNNNNSSYPTRSYSIIVYYVYRHLSGPKTMHEIHHM